MNHLRGPSLKACQWQPGPWPCSRYASRTTARRASVPWTRTAYMLPVPVVVWRGRAYGRRTVLAHVHGCCRPAAASGCSNASMLTLPSLHSCLGGSALTQSCLQVACLLKAAAEFEPVCRCSTEAPSSSAAARSFMAGECQGEAHQGTVTEGPASESVTVTGTDSRGGNYIVSVPGATECWRQLAHMHMEWHTCQLECWHAWRP